MTFEKLWEREGKHIDFIHKSSALDGFFAGRKEERLRLEKRLLSCFRALYGISSDEFMMAEAQIKGVVGCEKAGSVKPHEVTEISTGGGRPKSERTASQEPK